MRSRSSRPAFAQVPGTDERDAFQERLGQEFAQYFDGPWASRRDALDALLACNNRPTEWRLIGGIDADSILEERARYARVGKTLPAGRYLPRSRPRC